LAYRFVGQAVAERGRLDPEAGHRPAQGDGAQLRHHQGHQPVRQRRVDQVLVRAHALHVGGPGGRVHREHPVEAAHVEARGPGCGPGAEQVGGAFGQPDRLARGHRGVRPPQRVHRFIMVNGVIHTLSAHVITLRPAPGNGGMSTPAVSRPTPGSTVTVAGMPSPAIAALDSAGLPYRLVSHGAVGSLAEAAAARGVAVPDVVKTIVVRRGADDHLFVLTPGDRVISWPKLRALLGVQRISMPDAAGALAATGYERGTITPFGASTAWPVIADERLRGREITLGAGERGLAVAVDADAAITALGATVADVTDPQPTR